MGVESNRRPRSEVVYLVPQRNNEVDGLARSLRIGTDTDETVHSRRFRLIERLRYPHVFRHVALLDVTVRVDPAHPELTLCAEETASHPFAPGGHPGSHPTSPRQATGSPRRDHPIRCASRSP